MKRTPKQCRLALKRMVEGGYTQPAGNPAQCINSLYRPNHYPINRKSEPGAVAYPQTCVAGSGNFLVSNIVMRAHGWEWTRLKQVSHDCHNRRSLSLAHPLPFPDLPKLFWVFFLFLGAFFTSTSISKTQKKTGREAFARADTPTGRLTASTARTCAGLAWTA